MAASGAEWIVGVRCWHYYLNLSKKSMAPRSASRFSPGDGDLTDRWGASALAREARSHFDLMS
jgi:hypothetical protein